MLYYNRSLMVYRSNIRIKPAIGLMHNKERTQVSYRKVCLRKQLKPLDQSCTSNAYLYFFYDEDMDELCYK